MQGYINFGFPKLASYLVSSHFGREWKLSETLRQLESFILWNTKDVRPWWALKGYPYKI